VPGEDPYLVGEYAEWFVKGMEQAPEDERYIQASADSRTHVLTSGRTDGLSD
jgi:beta-glucosidase-like glycosyl hydrolase